MKNIKEIISSSRIKGIPDYFSVFKRIEKEIIKDRKLLCDKTIKVALLSSFTIDGLKEILFVKCCELGIYSSFYVGDYNQYAQDILNIDSGLYRFAPDLIIIFVDTITILGEQYFMSYQISDKQRQDWVGKKSEEIQMLIRQIKENSSAKILLHNFEVPIYSPLGIVENKQGFGFIETIEELNASLRDNSKTDSQVFLFDYNAFCSKIGKQNIKDYKMYYLGDMRLSWKYMPELCKDYLSYIKPLLSLTRKCIVLDLDDTLWGGVVGEDGLKGIRLGPTPDGRPFWEFQKYILSLFNRGVILAVNSKNNLNDVLNVFREHPYMVLKEKHFSAMQINWDDKISNMKAIAEEINVGMESLVFIDDDKLNREMVKGALPEVYVVDLPEDTSLYVKTIMEINDFNTLQLTEEDKKKGEMYAAQKRRHGIKKSVTDITEYLRELETVVQIEKVNQFTIPRISQLTQKTNQFNMTTKRYLEEDIKQFANSDKFLVVSAKVEDKFGDNGITGVIIVEKAEDRWRIDTFLLSCRVLGRKIEETLLAYTIEKARDENVKTLIGEFAQTKKNLPAKGFYENNGFRLIKQDNGMEIWEYDLRNEYPFLDYIKVIRKG